jgi:hypothetical protein
MTVRSATEADVPAIVAMGRQFHDKAGMSFDYDAEASGGFVRGLIAGGIVLISEGGMIGGVIAPSFSAPSYRMAVELFWWAERDGLVLLKAFEEWAAGEGADEVRMSTLACLPRAEILLRRKGYSACEISHRKVI